MMDSAMKDLVEARFNVMKMEIDEKWRLREMNIKKVFNDAQLRMEEQLKLARLERDDQLQWAWTEILAEINRFQDGSLASASYKRMELRFRKKVSSSTFLTGEVIKGEGNTNCIEVALLYNSTNEVVNVGPEASAMVEIVVLQSGTDAFDRDDWTVEEFRGMIVEEVQGKRPILAGNLLIKLEGGIGMWDDIRFKHHAIKLKPSMLRLGARTVETFDGVLVKEAKTESFHLRDFRHKYNRKHEIPSLYDCVGRLRNIQKGGKTDERLQAEGITTVEEFLIQLLKDDQKLKKIVRSKGKNWDTIVNHARKCLNDGRRYCYINSDHSAGIIFDIFGQIQGLYSEGNYVVTSTLSQEKQVDAHQLFSVAISKWDEISLVADDICLHQHFADQFGESSNNKYRRPNHDGDDDPIAAILQHGLEEPFGVDDVEIYEEDECPIIFQSCSPNSSSTFDMCTMFEDFDQFPIRSRPAMKRWKKLVSISKWFSVRKTAAFKAKAANHGGFRPIKA